MAPAAHRAQVVGIVRPAVRARDDVVDLLRRLAAQLTATAVAREHLLAQPLPAPA